MINDAIILAHGSGGRLTHDLIRDVFARHLGNPLLDKQEDAAVWEQALAPGERLAFTTDSYVVQPIFFPGGDIGKLAVCGTVNDLAMVGARPIHLSAAFILEEGLPIADLDRIVSSMASTARRAGVAIVAGDTKVVDQGSADSVFITTAGVGVVGAGVNISASAAQVGDVVMVSGPVGIHGLAIMLQREGLQFSFPLESDCAPLNGMVARVLSSSGLIHCLRDPTRGGLATTLCEIAMQSQVGIELDEEDIPIPDSVRAACEILGLDPLYSANEGKLIAVVSPDSAESVLSSLRSHDLGRGAAIIGRITSSHPGQVVLRTPLSTRRVLSMLSGAQLPRIC